MVTWASVPTSGTYTPSHSVSLWGYKGCYLLYAITYYTAEGAPTVMVTRLAIKTAASQTLVIPSSGFAFNVDLCDPADTEHQGTELIQVVDRKGAVYDSQSRSFDCRLSRQPS